MTCIFYSLLDNTWKNLYPKRTRELFCIIFDYFIINLLADISLGTGTKLISPSPYPWKYTQYGAIDD